MTVWDIGSAPSKRKKKRERELPQKSSCEPFSRTKKPHRKSVNLKDRDQLGKRNGEERGPARTTHRRRPTRIRELDEKIISKVLFYKYYYRRFFLRSIFIAIFIVHNPRVVRTKKKYAYCFAIRKLLKPKPVISLEIISLATGFRAKEKSHHSLGLARLEDEK